MNVTVADVICTAATGDRFWKLPSANVRGAAIKYLRLPENCLDLAMEEERQQNTQIEPRGRGRRGGGSFTDGRGRGGRTYHNNIRGGGGYNAGGRGGRGDGRGGYRGSGRGGGRSTTTAGRTPTSSNR